MGDNGVENTTNESINRQLFIIMREISFDESKKILTETLKSIDRCCRDNQIPYSLTWGTLIGAIRHHGIIPWDDDIDLMMKREDYNRFLKIYNDPQYEVYCPQKTPGFYHILTKVSNKGTAIYYNFWKDSPHGVWISIFPYDNVPDVESKSWRLKRSVLLQLYHIRTSRWTYTRKWYANVVIAISRLFLIPISPNIMFRQIEKCLTKYNGQKTKNISIWDNGYGYTRFARFPSVLFEECIDVDFEGGKFSVIKGYDQFLRQYYGDYMTPPPVEKQVPSHDYKAYYVD